METLGACPTASSRAPPSTWETRSATAATPASSWRATPFSPATRAPRAVPCGTSPCPPAEVGSRPGPVGENAGTFSGTQTPVGKLYHPFQQGPCLGDPRYSRIFSPSPDLALRCALSHSLFPISIDCPHPLPSCLRRSMASLPITNHLLMCVDLSPSCFPPDLTLAISFSLSYTQPYSYLMVSSSPSINMLTMSLFQQSFPPKKIPPPFNATSASAPS